MGAATDDRPARRVWPVLAAASLATAGAALDRAFPVQEPRRVAASARTKPALVQIDPDEADRALVGVPWEPGGCAAMDVSQPGDFVGGHSGQTSGACYIGPVVWCCTQGWDEFPSGYSQVRCEGPISCESFESWATNQPTPSHRVLSSERLEHRASADGTVAAYRCADATGQRAGATSARAAFRVDAPREVPSPVPTRVPPPEGLRGVATRVREAAAAHGPRAAAVLLLGAIVGALATLAAGPPGRRRRWQVVTAVAFASLLSGSAERVLRAIGVAEGARGERLVMRPIDPAAPGGRPTVGGSSSVPRWSAPAVRASPIVPTAWVKLPPAAATPSGSYGELE